jgi:hypothetical protein
MTINHKSIITALDKHFPKDKQDYFESITGKPITSFINIFFNAVVFDIDKFDKFLRLDNEYLHHDISVNNYLKTKYGEEFYNFFKENLVCNQFNTIAVIL